MYYIIRFPKRPIVSPTLNIRIRHPFDSNREKSVDVPRKFTPQSTFLGQICPPEASTAGLAPTPLITPPAATPRSAVPVRSSPTFLFVHLLLIDIHFGTLYKSSSLLSIIKYYHTYLAFILRYLCVFYYLLNYYLSIYDLHLN